MQNYFEIPEISFNTKELQEVYKNNVNEWASYGVYKNSVAISDRITYLVKKYPKDDLILPSKALLEELKSTFGLDYLVTSTDSKKYDFKIAYQNADFIVYKL